ncbi:MAG TPA: hypothetical protein VFW44_15230 [Bryobacteraceae bacterium]|nr:hypothetical protein [Bryobacteraceae bacterium]
MNLIQSQRLPSPKVEEDSSPFRIQRWARNVQSVVSALIEITREDIVHTLKSAEEGFLRADAALKSFCFGYPATLEQFEQWKHLRDAWDESDAALQAAREDLRDFDRGRLISD